MWKARSSKGSRRPSRRKSQSELAAQLREDTGGVGRPSGDAAPEHSWAAVGSGTPQLAGPGGQSVFRARSSPLKSPANETVPQWAPLCVHPRRQRGPKGLRGLSVEKLRGMPRVCAEVTHGSPAYRAARDSALGLPSSWVAHLRIALARPGGCRGAAGRRSFPQSRNSPTPPCLSSEGSARGWRGPDSIVERRSLGWAR